MVTLSTTQFRPGVTLAPDSSPKATKEGFNRSLSRRFTAFENLVGTVPALALEAVDITSASLGFTERNDISDAITEDLPAARAFIDQHKGALEAGVGVAAIVVSAIPSVGVTRGAGILGKTLARIPGIRKVTRLDAISRKARLKVSVADIQLLKQGVNGPNSVMGDVIIGGKGFKRNQLATAAKVAAFTRGATQGAAAELALAVFQNQNEFLFSEETASNLVFASIGIVIPGTINSVVMGSSFRKFLNQDHISSLSAKAVDPGGFNTFVEQPLNAIGKPGKITAMGGLDSDVGTRHFLAADAKVSQEVDGDTVSFTLFSNRQSAAIEDLQRGFEALDRVAIKGIPGTEDTAFRMGAGKGSSKEIDQHVRVITKLDPTSMFGVEVMARIPPGATPEGMFARFGDETEKLKEKAVALLELKTPEGNAAAELIGEQAAFRGTFVPMLVRNMDLIPIEDAGRAVNPSTATVVAESTGGKTALWKIDGSKLAVDDRGQLISPKGFKLDSLDQEGIQDLYRVADQAINTILKRRNPVLEVRANATWFELDTAAQFLEQSKGVGTVKWPAGLDEFSAEVESLAQKVDAIKARGTVTGEDFLAREFFNLPQPVSYERGLRGDADTALDLLIKGAVDGNEIRTFDNVTIKQTLADFRKAADLAEFTSDDIRLRGNSHKLGKDLEGNDIESFLVLKRPFGPSFFARDHFETRLADQAADVVSSLTNIRNDGTFIQRATVSLVGGEDFKLATRTSNLNDLSTTGTLPFRGNTTAQTSFTNFDFAFRDHPEMLAAQRIQDTMRRETSAFFSEVTSKQPVIGGRTASEVFQNLGTRQRENSSQLVNQFFTARRGWDVLDAVETSGGMTTFKLVDSPSNRLLFKARFGSDMPKGQQLLHGDGSIVRVDDAALDALKAFTHIGDAILKESNALLRAKGFGELTRAAWYIPPRNLNKSFVRFVVDGNGTPLQILAGKTESDIQRLVKKWETATQRPGEKLLSQTQVERFTTLWDRAMTGLNDPTIPVISTGKKRTGSAQSPFVEFNAWQEGLETFQRQFHRLGNDVIGLNMKNQIDMAQARASALRGGDQPNLPFRGAAAKNKEVNIHDLYIEALLGQNPLNNAGSLFGKVSLALEDIANPALQSLQETIAVSSLNPFRGGKRRAEAQYKRLQATMADDLPFKDINDFIEQKFAQTTPLTVRKLSAKVNQVTAGLTIKWAETGHAILTVTGMINSSPSVIRSFTRINGENAEQYAKRIGHSAHTFNTEDGVVGVMDMGKIMVRSMGRAWKGKKAFTPEEWEFINSRGYLSQEIAELQDGMVNMGKSQEGWDKFWGGADKWLGLLSTKSEEFARSYSHHLGLDIAENVMGIKGFEAQNIFAHDVANKSIANYNPLNRPQIFQGGVGAPLGLFQSYMFNYYQRLYRYVENKDAKSFAMQMAMQGGLFGAVSVPGWAAYNTVMGWTQDGKTTPYDGVYDRFGTEAGDLITSGVLSNLPKLFGASDGVALSSRGDVNPRLPGLNPPPFVTIAKNLFTGIGRGVDMFRSDHPGVTGTEVAEVMGKMFTNRPLSGFVEIMLGQSVDAQGNVISTEVRDGMNSIFRLAGLKPLKEQKQTEAFFANRTQNQIRLAAMGRLRRAGRAAIRGGNFEQLPKILDKYLLNGGSVTGYRSYLKELVRSAETPRAERQLMEVIGNPDKMEQTNRLLDMIISE